MSEDDVTKKSLAVLNSDAAVVVKIPIKLAVILLAIGQKNDICKPYGENLLDLQRQIAKQLK
jgi:hypothetical protein